MSGSSLALSTTISRNLGAIIQGMCPIYQFLFRKIFVTLILNHLLGQLQTRSHKMLPKTPNFCTSQYSQVSIYYMAPAPQISKSCTFLKVLQVTIQERIQNFLSSTAHTHIPKYFLRSQMHILFPQISTHPKFICLALSLLPLSSSAKPSINDDPLPFINYKRHFLWTRSSIVMRRF